MPRPRKNPDELLKRELRITPPNQVPIEDWLLDDTVVKFVAFEEGGADTGKKLHYHCYIETLMTSQALPKWIYRVANCIETGERGNAVFFTKAPHDRTFGYISKNRNCIISHNFETNIIDKWFKQSDEYVKQRATERKRDQRSRQTELAEVIEHVKQRLEQNYINPYPADIVQLILNVCKENSVRFPSRTQMEMYVIELSSMEIAVSYYLRSFNFPVEKIY